MELAISITTNSLIVAICQMFYQYVHNLSKQTVTILIVLYISFVSHLDVLTTTALIDMIGIKSECIKAFPFSQHISTLKVFRINITDLSCIWLVTDIITKQTLNGKFISMTYRCKRI